MDGQWNLFVHKKQFVVSFFFLSCVEATMVNTLDRLQQ
jgi:hypothetical protein